MDRAIKYIIGAGIAAAVGSFIFLSCENKPRYILKGDGLAYEVAKKLEQFAELSGKQKISGGVKISTIGSRKGRSEEWAVMTVYNRLDQGFGCGPEKDMLKFELNSELYEVNRRSMEILGGTGTMRKGTIVDEGIDGIMDKPSTFTGFIEGTKSGKAKNLGAHEAYKILLEEANSNLAEGISELKKLQTKN